MGCWVTPNFFQSQPLAIYADIPQNATSVTLTAGQGRGDYYAYKLHSCYYPTCTTFNYFRNNCPSVGTFGFGVTDVTSLFSPGSHSLYLHGLPDSGFSSTAISGGLLTVYFPVMFFSATKKHFTYNSNQTTCSADVAVNGTGQCFYPAIPLNAAVSNSTQNISVSSNGTHVLWNCSTGDYSLNLQYLPISFNQSWQFNNSNLSRQHLLSTLVVSNPNNDSFTGVPFMFNFNPGFERESIGALNGTINITALENKQLNATFSASVISYNLSFSPIYFNFSRSSMLASLSVENNFSISFNFSTLNLPLELFNCNESNFTVKTASSFSIACAPSVNYSFSNWTGINATLVSSILSISTPANLTVEVSNVSSTASQLFQKEVLALPDSFAYVDTTPVNLTSDFVTIALQNTSTTDSEELNYSISLNDRADLGFNIPLQLDFSNYLNVSLTSGNLVCTITPCIENKILTTTIFNQTNFSLVAFKHFAIETTGVSSASQPISTSQGAGAGAPLSSIETNVAVEENTDIFPQDDDAAELIHSPQAVGEGKLTMEDLPTPIELNEAHPFSLSGFFTAIPSAVFLLPFGLLALLGSYVVLKKQPLVKRSVQNGKTTINISNMFSSPLAKLVVTELLPIDSSVQTVGKPKASAVGKAIVWKKSMLKKGEKWQVSYVSNLAAKKGKLSFMQNGKKIEKLF